MNKLYLVLALLFVLSACSVSVGKKCLYTDEGTIVSSYVWIGDKVNEISKLNCN